MQFFGKEYLFKTPFRVASHSGDLLAAPYGGLFLPRAAVEKSIFPDRKFFLYADDYDYTFRLCVQGGFNIVFVRSPEIMDLEKSFHVQNREFSLFKNRYSSATEQQLYFSVRNQVYFSLRESSFAAKFFLNMAVISPIFLVQFLMVFKYQKAYLFLKAMIAGTRWGLASRFAD